MFKRMATLGLILTTVPTTAIAAGAKAQSVAPARAAKPVPGSTEEIQAQIQDEQIRIALWRQLKALREQEAGLKAENAEIARQDAAPLPAPAAPPATTADTPDAPAAPAKPATEGNQPNSLGGLKFGAGIGFTYDLGHHDRIKTASLVNGIVRITEQENVRARLMLESHYFFTPKGFLSPNGKFLGLAQGDWGVGPFIALQGGPSDVIEGIGGGVMLGLKRLRANGDSSGASTKSAAASDGSSFNIGLGVFYDLSVQTLGEGITANQPLPAGETEIRFSKRSQSGFMILSSFAF